MKTVGECLEFMLMNKILEALCAYSMVDKPTGFFKFGLEILTEII
jgi:fructose-specific phosphotransferase system IIC component